jgi:hypothetical protein
MENTDKFLNLDVDRQEMDIELSRIQQEVKDLQHDKKAQLDEEKLKVMHSIQSQVRVCECVD